MKFQSFSSSQSSSKTKTLTHNHNLFFSFLRRFSKSLSKAKSNFSHILNKPINKKKKNNTKTFFGSFRLHYNWCSSRVMHVPDDVLYMAINRESEPEPEPVPEQEEYSQLSGYLQWLEEKKDKVCDNSSPKENANENEIDKLAELFIASNYEKFKLEKQESYRRLQELELLG